MHRAVSSVAVAAVVLGGTPGFTADLVWDSDGVSGGLTGGGGTWDTSSLLWDNAGSMQAWLNANNDVADFGGTPGIVALGAPITAGGLTFSSNGYSLSGGTLTLTSPSSLGAALLNVTTLGHTATIQSQILGTNGLTKTGLGNVVLTGTNNYTGFTVVNNGTLTITDPAGLGSSTSSVIVNGTRAFGFSGGTLRVSGGQAGMTFNRNIRVAGSGANNLNAALISLGGNTFNGNLTFGPGESRIAANGGNTVLNGRVTIGTSDNLRYFYGNGNWIINGLVTGGGVNANGLFKAASGLTSTLVLNNQSNNFASLVRVDGGTIRVSHAGALGLATGAASMHGSGGTFEIRSDAADVGSFATRNVSLATGSFSIFVDRAVGGSSINQIVAFNQVTQTNSRTLTLAGRNGYGVTFLSMAGSGNGTSSEAFTNNTNGTVTYAGDIWGEASTTAVTLTLGGNAETVITGSILATGAAHTVTKSGTGRLTVGGNASTTSGTVRVTAGTLSVADMGALGTATLSLGNATTTAGTFTYTGAGQPSAAPIFLNTTTANAFLNASGSGALVLSGPITYAAAGGNKTLVLGGTSTAANEIASVIADSTGTNFTNVQKIGSGNWVLSGPNTFGTAAGATGVTVSGGTLQIKDTFVGTSRNVLVNTVPVVFNVDAFTQAAAGTFEYLGADAVASSEAVGVLTATTGAGTVKLAPGAGIGTAALTFAGFGAIGSGGALNFIAPTTPGNSITVTGSADVNGMLNARFYFNGADFASSTGGVIGAATYTPAVAPMAAGNTTPYRIDGSFTQDANVTVNAGLKFNGAQILTLDPGVTLTINNGANTAAGILATGGASQITGGVALTNGVASGVADFVVRVDQAGDSLAINSPISGGSGGTSSVVLVKNGAGALVLGGANTFGGNSGGVVINEGTLQLANAGTLGAVNNALTIRQGGTLDLNGVNVGTLTSGGVGAFNGAGSVTNSAVVTTAVLRVGNNDSGGYFTGLLADGVPTARLSFSKAGAGTVSLTGLNTFTGPVHIDAGNLAITSIGDIGIASALGRGDATSDATNAASLVFNGTSTGALVYTGANATIFQETQTPSVSTNRLFTLAGNGFIESSGQYGNNVLAAGSANHATLVFRNTADVVFAGAGIRTLTLGGTSLGDNEMRIRMVDNGSDALSLTKGGAGLWILNPLTSNSYSGATTITGGALRVGPDGGAVLGLPTSSNLVLNGGVLQTSGSFTRALGTGANQVQWTGNGGFSAGASKLTVNLGGGTPLILGTAPTAGSTIILSSSTALAEVELQNPINLGTSARTIQVDDNTSTGTDFAVVSGVISGGAGGNLTKSGTGVLYLGNANTYSGITTVSAGALVVQSIGAAGATATSVGTNVGGGELRLGNGAYLMYVGSGEVVTRTINVTSTTSGPTIDSSGSGAITIGAAGVNLISGSGAKTLTLRGFNTDANTILGNLNPVGGTLTVTKSDGGTWILAGNNTFTGTLTVGSGWLGAASGASLGAPATGAIVFSNGGLFASAGANISTARAVQIAANTTALFTGANSIAFTGSITLNAGSNDQSWLINNTISGGTLTLDPGGLGAGTITNGETSTTDTLFLRFEGSGSTIVLGALVNHGVAANPTADGLGVVIQGTNSLNVTLGGTGTSTYTRNTLLTQGTLILAKANALGTFTATNNLLQFNGGVLRTSVPGGTTVGNRTTIGGNIATISGTESLTFSGTVVNNAGSRTLQNDLTAGELILSGQVDLSEHATTARTLTILGSGTTSISGTVSNGVGTGASALAYSGNGVLVLTGNNTATGTLIANRGTVVLRGAVGNWAGNAAINGIGTLSLDNTSVESFVGGGRILDTAALTTNGGTLQFIGDGDGSSETVNTYTINNILTRITMSGFGPNTLLFNTVNFANTGSSLDLTSIGALGSMNKVVFGAGFAPVNNILNRVWINGDFATHGANGVEPFTAYNGSNNLITALDADTMELTVDANIGNSRTLNALKINGAGITIGGGVGRVLTLTAGSVLNTGGDNTLTVQQVSFAAGGNLFQVDSGTTLDVTSHLIGAGSINKVGSGTLQLSARNFYASTTNVNAGTLRLGGGLNRIMPLLQVLNIAPGATVDLNGNSQYMGVLGGSATVLPGTGGTLTNSGALSTFVTSGGGAFGGQITGAINLGRIGGGTLTLATAQAYTGATSLFGGTTTLESDATLLNTTAIDLHYATLTLNNGTGLQVDATNRIGDAIPISMRGATFTFQGRTMSASAETLGAVTIVEGANTFNINTGNSGTYFSADLTIASLTRAFGTTVNFATAANTLGAIDNNPRILFINPLAVESNNILGPWAVVNAGDFAAYNPAMGVGAVGAVGFEDYATFLGGGTATNPAVLASGGIANLQATAAHVTTLSADTTTSLLRLSGGFTNDIAFGTGNETLNLEHGGLLRSNNNNASTIGSETLRGVLTAGGTETAGTRELFLYNAQNTLTIHSTIQNNGLGNSVTLVKSGAGTTRVTAANTYTGGTVVAQGTLQLAAQGLNGIANHVVVPAGGLTINGATVTMLTNQGQIDPTNVVTLNGSSTLTLVGTNTLERLVFNNSGGSTAPTVTVGAQLSLSHATPISVTTSNAATVPVVAGGILDLGSGTKTFSIEAPTLGGVAYADIHPALSITSVITGTANIDKTGAGLLQVSGQSTFTGNLNVLGGGIVLAASSTGAVPTTMATSPLGLGTVTMSIGTSIFNDATSRSVANAINFLGDPIFNKTDASVDTLSLNGSLNFATLATTGLTVNVDSPYLNVVLGGQIAGIGSVTAVGGTGANTISKVGLGNLTGVNLTGLGAGVPITLTDLTNTSFSLLHDGDGTSSFETINLGTVSWEPVNGVLALTVDRAGAGAYFPTPAFKTIALASLNSSVLPRGLAVTNNNNYGLLVPDAISAATVAADTGPTFRVTALTTSLQNPGLTLSGVLSGGPTGATARTFIKAGAGVLVLGNSGNTFGGGGSIIDITDGLLAVASDGALGDASNVVRISANNAAEGLRVTASLTTARVIDLADAASGIEVTAGNTLTLNTAFTFGAATNSLAKNDLGTLSLTQAQTGWDGVITINQGVLRISHANALGSTAGNTTFGNVGGALELTGSIVVPENLVFNSGDDVTTNGVNGAGAVRSIGGINRLTGTIAMIGAAQNTDSRSRAGTFTADAGSTLHLDGVITGSVGAGTGRDSWIGLGGEGDGFINAAMALTGTVGTNRFFAINKFGTGTWTITAADAHPGTRVHIKQGTLELSGAGSLGAPTAGQETVPTVYFNPTGVLRLDNTAANVDNRLAGRAVNLASGEIRILGNVANPTVETVGAFALREGLSIFTLDADAAQSLEFTTGALTRTAGGTLLVRGDGLGSAAAAGVATMKGGAYAFIGQTGGTNSINKSILPWALGDTNLNGGGVGFLTADSAALDVNTGTNILRFLNSNEQVADFMTADANVNLATTELHFYPTPYNSLRLDAGGGAVLTYLPLSLASGGLLALSGNTGIAGFSGVSYLTTVGNAELVVHSVGNLDLNVPIAGTTGGITKSGAGTLTLTAGNTNHGSVNVNEGTLKLGGGDQTIFPGRSLILNAGGTLDLNGTVQHFNLLESRLITALAQSDLFSANTGGLVVNSSGSQATLGLATASVTFAGSIQGDIAVARAAAASGFVDWNLYSDQTYTGPTLLNGGRTQLLDGGRLSGTSSIEISNAMLLLGSSNASVEPSDFTDRIRDAAPITLRGGILQLRARASLYTTETMGVVTLAGGNSMIDVAEGGTRINQFDATIADLVRASGTRATIRFLNIDSLPNDDARLFITNAPTLANNIIGGWAVFEREFASYTSAGGVGALNGPGYAGYSPNLLNNGTAADNIRIAATGTTMMSADRAINTLAIVVGGATTLDLGGNILNLGSGGLIASNSTNDTAITIQNGSLTAGGAPNTAADLYLHSFGYVNGNTDAVNRDVIISADIVDNGLGTLTLVINAGDGRGTGLGGLLGAESTNLTGNNTYTGGTFVNAGRVILNNPNANGTTFTAIGSGNLTISGGASTNGSTFDEFTTKVVFGASDQIANTATVAILGAAQLNLNNFSQTLAGVTFNNTGGHTPTLATGTGTLTLNGDITASGQNLGTISTITGKIDFGAVTRTITVNPVAWNGKILNPILPNLLISAVIDGTNIVKTGAGTLRVSAANGYTGSFDLQAGGLSLGANTALSSGTLIIGNNTFLTSTADNRVLTNAYTVSGNFSLRDVFNLTLNGPGTLTAGNHDVSVEFSTKILALGGVLSGASASITKTGDGILVLGNNSNSYGGSTTIADGTLRYGAIDAVPTGSAVTVLEGAMFDITNGGSVVTVGSLASNSATVGGAVVTTATSGTTTFTVGGDDTSTAFGGVITAGFGATLNFTKVGAGTLTLGGSNQYNGVTTVAAGRLVAKSVGGDTPLGTSLSLVLGGGTTSGILQLGDSAAPLDHLFTSLATAGTGTQNAVVSGNAASATLTLNLAATSTFRGNIGGVGPNEGNLNLVKSGAGDLVISGTGTSTYVGTTAVNEGKLFMDTVGAFSTTTTSLTLADGTEFALRGTSNVAHQIYGFSGAGNKITIGTATLGFGIDGAFNSRLHLAAGQTMDVNGTLTTAVYVNSAPNAGQKYVLINGTDALSLSGLGGVFSTSPVIFNGGSFSYALSFDSGVDGGGLEQWVLTPTAVPAAADTWWKGDLTGLGTAVWSATTTSGTGFPSNWDTDQASGIDAVVPPDSGSIVHFAANGAANFNTTVGANVTIQELIFHTGAPAVSIGNSNGTNTLTLGNTVDASGLMIQTGAGDVDVSAVIALAQNQSWNIEDTARVLTLSGGLTGGFNLTVNDLTTNSGGLRFTGTAGGLAGTLNMNAGSLLFEGTGGLAGSTNVVLGTAAKAATLFVGGAGGAATNAIIGGLSNGTFAGSRVVGGNAAMSTLTIAPTSGTSTFTGALGGAGTDENQFNLVKAGAGTQVLNGATITYAGTTIVREGTLQLGSSAVFAATGALSVVANAGTTATFDFNGKSYATIGDLTLAGGNTGVARIIDGNATKGVLTLGGNIIFDATNDPGGAVISANLNGGSATRTITVGDSVGVASDLTLAGTFSQTGDFGLIIAGPGGGTISGNISISGAATSSRDFTFNSTGTWTILAKIETGDDIIINSGVLNANAVESIDAEDVIIDGLGTPGSAVVNINAATVHTGDDFFIRNGGLVNIFTANGLGTSMDALLIGDSASASAAAAGVLNFSNNVQISPASFSLGAAGGQIGRITGTGTLSTSGTKTLSNGEIGSGITLAGSGAMTKTTTGVVTFAGTRTATGATNLQEGELILDYTTNNASKIGGVFSLGLVTTVNPAMLTINGNASTATTQSVTSTTVLPGRTTIAVNNGASQTATLALGAITRSTVGGTLNFEYSSASAAATTTNPVGTLGWATVTVGVGGTKRLAAVNGSGQIVAATMTDQNDVTQWQAGQNIINSAAFTGTADECNTIASLTFAASANSTVSIASSARLGITSGGIFVDSAIGTFTSTISGGELYGNLSGTPGEFIVHQNNAASTLTIASRIVNSAGLTKLGVGTLILSGSNTFLPTGSQVHVTEGTLRIAGGNAIGDTTQLHMRAGTTFDLANSTETIGNLMNASTGTIALGTGALTINQTANSTYSGVFTGAAGAVLNVNNLGFNFALTGSTTTGYLGTVVVNSGLFQLAGSAGRLSGATSFTLNKGASFLIDNDDDSAPNDRLSDSAAFVLNSADGVFAGEARPRGLVIRSNNNGNESETIGALTFASGASYANLEASGGASSQNNIVSSGWTRSNSATINVRGRNLGGTAANNSTQFRIADANDAAFMTANLVGGGAATGVGNDDISILPWAIGESLAAALADANMGNTFVSYVDNRGLVPLNLADEYAQFATAGATHNTRESFTADLTGLTGKTINSWVLHNASTGASTLNVTGAGASNALVNASGAFLFTLNTAATASTAHAVTLGGFDDGIQVGATNEYVFFVVNPSSAATTPTLRATIASPLNTVAASLTKSGRGTLELTAVNTYGGGTTINEGALLIHDNDNLGVGNLRLAGGTLQLAADYTDDLGTLTNPTLTVLTGGGTIDVLAANVMATNLLLAGTAGTLTKAGTGTLQLAGNAASTFTGDVLVQRGLLELNKSSGINGLGSGRLTIGFNSANTQPSTVRLLADNQIANAAAVSLRSIGTDSLATLDVNGFSDSIGALTLGASTGSGVLVRIGTGGVLTVGGDITLNSDRSLNDGGTNARNVVITGTGTIGSGAAGGGTLNLGGVNRVIRVQTVSTAGGNNDAVIEAIVANGGIVKEGARRLHLTASNTYAGPTVINDGTIVIVAADNLGDGSATNTININHSAILQSAGADVDLGVNRSVLLDGNGGQLEVTGANILTISGVVTGHDCAALTKLGTGRLELTATNLYEGTTRITAGTLQIGDGGATGTLGLGDVINNAVLAFNRTNTLAVSNAISGTGAVNQLGTGTTVLSGVNAYTGVTTIGAGTLQFAQRTSLYDNTPANWTATNLVVSGGATAAFNVGGAGEFTLADIDTLKALGTATGGFLDGSFLGIDTTGASGVVSYGSLIADTNGGANRIGITKLGIGTLELTGANTYTGVTKVMGGVLQIASEANLGGDPGSPAADQLTLNGGTLATTATFAFDDANRGITVGPFGGGFDVATGTTLTIAATNVISGAGSGTLAKTGGGRLVINSTSSYSGATNVSAGTLTIGDGVVAGAATGGGGTDVGASGVVNGGGAGTTAGTVGGNLTVVAGGTFSSGTNSNGASGNGVGAMNVGGNSEWDADANLIFDFSSTSGNQTGTEATVGTNWDYLSIAGTLNLDVGVQKINLYVNSWGVSGYGQNGGANQFDVDAAPTVDTHGGLNYSYTWKWAEANSITINGGAGLTGDVNLSDYFNVQTGVVDPTTFGNGVFTPGSYTANATGGTFWVSAIGNSLYINYSSVPEPGSLLLLGVAGLGMAGYRWSRRRGRRDDDGAESSAKQS